jgi:hypothetical protein
MYLTPWNVTSTECNIWPLKWSLITNALDILLIWCTLPGAVCLMYFPTNTGDSVVLINVPWPISAHAMSPGQIKLRNWSSLCNDYHKILHIYAYLYLHRNRRGLHRAATKLVAQQKRHDTYASSTYDEDRCQRQFGTGVNGKTTKRFRWWHRRFKYTRDEYANLDVTSCERFQVKIARAIQRFERCSKDGHFSN